MASFPPQIPPGPPQPAVPSLDLTGLCFRDQIFLNFVGGCLVPGNVFDYFANSPFYDRTCNNEQLRMQGVHPLDTARLREMVGWEYALHMAQEPHLFVLRKQKRDGPDRTTPVAAYYILDGSIYQAPSLHAVISSRISRALHHLRAAFAMTRAALDNPEAARPKEDGSEEAVEGPETPVASEGKPSAADIREMARLDHVVMSVVRKLAPAPPPPDIALPAEPQAAGGAAAGDAATAEDKTGGTDGTAAAGAGAASTAAAPAAAGAGARGGGAAAGPGTGAAAASKKGGAGKASTTSKKGTGGVKGKAGSGVKAGTAGKGGAAGGTGGGAGSASKPTKAAHPKPTQEGEGRKVKKAKKA